MKKIRGEIILKRKSNKLSKYLWFLDIFPVFYKFLHYFFFYLSILTFFTQFHAKIEIFSALRAICDTFYTTLFKTLKKFSLSFVKRHEDFILCWREKNRKEISMFLILWGGKNWNFGPKYLTLVRNFWSEIQVSEIFGNWCIAL